MEHFASTIGIPIPCFTARKAVMNCIKQSNSWKSKPRCTTEQLFTFEFSKNSLSRSTTDDETASTVSSDCSFSNSSSVGVSFAPCLVTAVYERPVTKLEDKRALYYCEKDYRRFRREYYEFRQRGSSLVHFCDDCVTQVHEYFLEGSETDLYYNEADLKRFLDDFVASLNERLM